MTAKTIRVSILAANGGCAIPVPFDPKAVFGKIRVPVKVTLNGFTFRSTIARMGGRTFIPLRKSNAEAARVTGGEHVEVRIELDADERTVEVPADLAAALEADAAMLAKWRELSYTNRRECVESVLGAKKQETRERRIAKVLALVAARPRAR